MRRGMVIDLEKCIGCRSCAVACKQHNAQPAGNWWNRVVTPGSDQHQTAPEKGREYFLPIHCQHCQNAPCEKVCPVGATYQTNDGVVLIDRKWCIGCGYCIMACPYGVRFFHPVYKVAEKCTFCYHRISKGLKAACVQACPFGARQMGNLKDPDDPVTQTIMTQRVGVLKSEYGTKPQVYYIGLDERVR